MDRHCIGSPKYYFGRNLHKIDDLKDKDQYKTIVVPSKEVLFKDRASKFFGVAFPVETEDDVKKCLEQLKTKHHKAGHFCYAWQLGKNYEHYRANDDGEPANSAGMPIFGQLQSFGVTNILVVVLRYFGGTKLGMGGLINAYRTTAKMALDDARIVTKTIDILFKISFGYPMMNKIMRLIKEQNIKITKQVLELDCAIFISVRKKDAERVSNLFDTMYGVKIMEQ